MSLLLFLTEKHAQEQEEQAEKCKTEDALMRCKRKISELMRASITDFLTFFLITPFGVSGCAGRRVQSSEI
jgi:hypothetical protein